MLKCKLLRVSIQYQFKIMFKLKFLSLVFFSKFSFRDHCAPKMEDKLGESLNVVDLKELFGLASDTKLWREKEELRCMLSLLFDPVLLSRCLCRITFLNSCLMISVFG